VAQIVNAYGVGEIRIGVQQRDRSSRRSLRLAKLLDRQPDVERQQMLAGLIATDGLAEHLGALGDLSRAPLEALRGELVAELVGQATDKLDECFDAAG
jgi:hypothetical protein